MNIGIQINKDLIGNLIILLTDRCKPLYQTKMMKLLFLIDEESTKEKGTPITWLDYKAWELGPVSPDLYFSKNIGYNKLNQYIRFESTGHNNAHIIRPIKSFDDSEFSEWDIEIINNVLNKYGNLTADELIAITHAKGTLWYESVKASNIRFTKDNKTSDISLNFVDLIKTDDYLKSVYYSALENVELKSTLK
jgi:uncharacterized phage-associated protein